MENQPNLSPETDVSQIPQAPIEQYSSPTPESSPPPSLTHSYMRVLMVVLGLVVLIAAYGAFAYMQGVWPFASLMNEETENNPAAQGSLALFTGPGFGRTIKAYTIDNSFNINRVLIYEGTDSVMQLVGNDLYYVDTSFQLVRRDLQSGEEEIVPLPEIIAGDWQAGVGDFHFDQESGDIFYLKGNCVEGFPCSLHRFNPESGRGEQIKVDLPGVEDRPIYGGFSFVDADQSNLTLVSRGGDGPCGGESYYSLDLTSNAIELVDRATHCACEAFGGPGASEFATCTTENESYDQLQRSFFLDTTTCGSLTIKQVGRREFEIRDALAERITVKDNFLGCVDGRPTDPLAQWDRYQNNFLGFTLLLPPEWTVDEENLGIQASPTEKRFHFKPADSQGLSNVNQGFIVELLSATSFDTLYPGKRGNGGDALFAGRTAKRTVLQKGFGYDVNEDVFYLEEGDFYLFIRITDPPIAGTDQILDTFRFQEHEGIPRPDTGMREVSRTDDLIRYEGTVTVTGRYEVDVLSLYGDALVFLPDESANAVFPEISGFAVTNPDETAPALGITRGDDCSYKGIATIVIRDFGTPVRGGDAPPFSKIETVLSSTPTSKTCHHFATEPFSSQFFTLSFKIPTGFGVNESQDLITIYKEPYLTREIGDSNEFFSIRRYSELYNRLTAEQQFRASTDGITESQVYVDGSFFIRLDGENTTHFEGDGAGRVSIIFFEASALTMQERLLNADPGFDTIETGDNILNTFRFSKNAY